MTILGIHYGHNATVAVIKEGELVFAMSEERFNRLKNSNGMPVKTLEYIYNNIVKPEEVDLAVMFQKDIAGYLGLKKVGFKSVRDFGEFNVNLFRRYSIIKNILYSIPGYFLLRSLLSKFKHFVNEKIDLYTQESLQYYSKALNLPKEKIIFSGHHQSHAYSACMNLEPNVKTLIFTMDGEGDGLSSTVSIYENYTLKNISSNPVGVSIGYFFTEITKYLGMIPNEHEFKVMGLAPYAKQDRARNLYDKHKHLIELDEDLRFKSGIPTNRLEFYFLKNLYGQRFDTIAAFAQIFLEEKVLEWVSAWIQKTGIKRIALSGGVFMSVKLNQKILELSNVEKLFIAPSGADESTAIGAAFYGEVYLAKQNKEIPKIKPYTNLYLGRNYNSKQVIEALTKSNAFSKFNVIEGTYENEIEVRVAKLLAENQVVGRFSGRSEWGARALGNRSILANAQSTDTVRIINEMIKNRDFWMPFASSIIEDDKDMYLKVIKAMEAPYMAITFETTELARKHITAAIHPYDFTCRPQIVYKSWNPSYYLLISEFKKLTGIGGILNTSFNLHGEPNVETPEDALRTFENSGLKFLALENYLITKK